MKKTSTKLLFALSLILTFAFSASSQDTSSEKFFKTNSELRGFKPAQMSDNGRFIVCNIAAQTASNVAMLWDTQTDVVTNLGNNCWACDVTNDGSVVVGQFLNPDVTFDGRPVIVQGYYKGGKWNMAEFIPTYEITAAGGGQIYSISPDGKWMGGHLPYKASHITPVVWNAEGKFVRSFGIDQATNHRSGLRAMSADGTKACGWSEVAEGTYYKGVWIPTFWDTQNDKTIHTSLGTAFGYLEGMNNSGSIAVGFEGSTGMIVKEDGEIIRIGESWMDVSEDELYVGLGVYSKELGLLGIDEYFTELHGLNVGGVSFIDAISDNGEYMSLMTWNGGFGVAIARVAGDVLPTPPVLITLIGGESRSVNIAWDAPLFNGHTPIGYNVYKDGEKANTTLITAMTFKDANTTAGKKCYTVTAVYKYTADDTERESEKAEPKCIEIIENDGCLAPKHLMANVEYNRTVNLSWQSPFPIYKSSMRTEDEDEDTLIQIKPSIVKSLTIGTCLAIASDGKYIYGLNGGSIDSYTLEGKLESGKSVNLPKMRYFRGLACDGTNVYTTEYKDMYRFTEIKPGAVGEVIPIQTTAKAATRISYLPFLDEGKGGFEIGSFKEEGFFPGTSFYIKKDGSLIEGGGIKPEDEVIMGVTSYKDIIYVGKRDKSRGVEMKIYLYSVATGLPTGEYIDMRDYKNITFDARDQLWNISVMNTLEGIPCLAVLYGKDFGNKQLVFLEIGSIEGLLGYNIYRNDEKINKEGLLTDSRFSEKLFNHGEYKYEVEAVFDNACTSNKSEPMNITIAEITPVNEPKNITTEIVRDNIIVSWEAPKHSAIPKLIGYNIFRDGVQLNPEEQYITDCFYSDKNLNVGIHKYEINAFYNNSGESVKISTEVELKGLNPILPPTGLALSQDDRDGVALTWKTPALGDYEVKTWFNGNLRDCVGVSEEGGILYTATKWDADDLGLIFNYTLTDIEFYSALNLPYTFYIYANDKLVGEQTMEQVRALEYNILKLDKPITIKKGESLMIACKVTHGAGERPLGVARFNSAVGKGDLTSKDGKTWVSCFESENFEATWAISARLMPYTLEAPQEIVGTGIEANTNMNLKLVASELVRSESTPIFKNAEVTGYNVYRNNEKINTTTVDTELFEDTSADLTKDNCYSVEAIFTADRKSPKSESVCTFGYCYAPTFTAIMKDGYPELKAIAPTEIVVNKNMKYYNAEGVESVAIDNDKPYYALLLFRPIDLELTSYDDYTIKSISAFLTSTKCSISLFAKQGDNIIIEQEIEKSNIKVGLNEWKITDVIKIDATSNLMIGIKIVAPINEFVVGTDAGPAIEYKSNIFAVGDAKMYTSLLSLSGGTFKGSWNLSVALEHKEKLKEECLGFNFYKDGEKINAEPIVDNIYIDKTAKSGMHVYHATALWNTNCESEPSEKVSINLTDVNDLETANIKIYPNPAQDILNIEGDIETVRFYNSCGKECGIFSGNGERGMGDYHQYSQVTVDVLNWSRGIYIIEVTSTTGDINRGKVIIK